jgi:hypothetical protein
MVSTCYQNHNYKGKASGQTIIKGQKKVREVASEEKAGLSEESAKELTDDKKKI